MSSQKLLLLNAKEAGNQGWLADRGRQAHRQASSVSEERARGNSQFLKNKVDRSIHIAKVIKPRALACLGVFSEVRRIIWRRASEWTEEAGLIAEGQ